MKGMKEEEGYKAARTYPSLDNSEGRGHSTDKGFI